MIKLLLCVLPALALIGPADAMTFREESTHGNCDEDCVWVAAVGEITPETPREFARFDAAQHGRIYTIFFNSSGGDLMAGVRLGQMIRARKLQTAVGASTLYDPALSRTIRTYPENGTCVSACAFALLGGVRRFFAGWDKKESEGQVGVRQLVHAPAARKPSGKQPNAADLVVSRLIPTLIDYVSKMGGDPRMIAIAASTPPSRVRYFSETELLDLRISWNPRAFGPWALEPSGDGVVARTQTLDRSESATFFCTQDRIPRLVLVSPRTRDERELREAIKWVGSDGFEALGTTWPATAVGVRSYDGQPALELILTGFDPNDLESTKDVAVRASAPRTTEYHFDYPLTAERARETLRIAIRNCV